MNSEIVKTLDTTINNLVIRRVFGLNTFQINKVDCQTFGNPQLEFLEAICLQDKVSANTGSLYDFADTPEELFGSIKNFTNYLNVRLGCYGGEFYDSEEWNLFPPLFFPLVNSNFINLKNDKGSLISRIMYSDALALFISPKDIDSENNILNLLNLPLSSSNEFIAKAAEFYKLIMITEADRSYFTFYSQKNESFNILNQSLLKAVHIIEESDWYKTNYQNLVWDDEYNGCLVDSANN